MTVQKQSRSAFTAQHCGSRICGRRVNLLAVPELAYAVCLARQVNCRQLCSKTGSGTGFRQPATFYDTGLLSFDVSERFPVAARAKAERAMLNLSSVRPLKAINYRLSLLKGEGRALTSVASACRSKTGYSNEGGSAFAPLPHCLSGIDPSLNVNVPPLFAKDSGSHVCVHLIPFTRSSCT